MEQYFEVRDKRNGFLWIGKEIVEDYAKIIGPSALLVYIILAKFADNKTSESFPTQAQIADLAGLSERTVRTVLTNLETVKLITIDKLPAKGGYFYNRYTLLQPPEEISGTPPEIGDVATGKKGHNHRKPTSGELDLELDSKELDSTSQQEIPTLEPTPEPTTTPNPSSGMTAMEERQERLRLADQKKAEKDAGKGKSMRQRQADRAIETFRGPKQPVQKESSEAKRFRENNEVLDGFDINPVFRRAILDTSIVMTKDLSHTLVSVLVDDLDPYPDEMIAAAFAKYRRSGEQFFPRSGTIIKLIEEIIKTEKPKESALERQSRENRERRAQNAKEAAGA